MARYDNSHSRLVATAKIVLPLLSLALLATLFLFARAPSYEPTIPFSKVELETLAHEQRIDSPTFSTVTRDGAELFLNAEKISPDLSNTDVINSSVIQGGLKFEDGSTLDLTARSAVIDGPSRIAELAGGVEITSSAGYVVATESIAAMLDVSRIESSGMVEADGPIGTFTAGRMEISQDIETENYLLVFKDGVKLVYQPKE